MKVTPDNLKSVLSSKTSAVWATLCFGDDEGVAADIGQNCTSFWKQNCGESEVRTLTEDDLQRDPACLSDLIEARPLLGGITIVRIQITGERFGKFIVEAIESAETRDLAPDNRLLVISGSLKASSKLRKSFESAQKACAIQSFRDDARGMESLVRSELDAESISIEPDAMARFISGLPGHRRLARNEIEKLKLYAGTQSAPLAVEDIAVISSADVDHALPKLIQAALLGRCGPALSELDRLTVAGTGTITILRGFQREAERLLSAHLAGVRDSSDAGKLRPPVWRTDWPSFRQRMQLWPEAHLVRLISRIHDCEALTKESAVIGPATLRKLIVDMSRLANR